MDVARSYATSLTGFFVRGTIQSFLCRTPYTFRSKGWHLRGQGPCCPCGFCFCFLLMNSSGYRENKRRSPTPFSDAKSMEGNGTIHAGYGFVSCCFRAQTGDLPTCKILHSSRRTRTWIRPLFKTNILWSCIRSTAFHRLL